MARPAAYVQRVGQPVQVPEGDTIHRTAATLRRWLVGRDVTAARVAPRVRIDPGPLVGSQVEAVEAVGKHLLITFRVGERTMVLRTHNRMTGSWHVYPTGSPWQRPPHQARLVVEAGDRTAVLFNAPDIELQSGHRGGGTGVDHLGPDILDQPPDVAAIVTAMGRRGPSEPIGDVLLDQTVVAGIGNIYRCEVMFLEGVDPAAPVGSLAAEQRTRLVHRAHELMTANLGHRPSGDGERDFGGGPGAAWVYRRVGRPCRRCGTTVRSATTGRFARTVYWCPSCQAPAARGAVGT